MDEELTAGPEFLFDVSLTMNMEKRRYIQMVIYLQAASSYSDRSLLFAHKLTPKRFPAHMYVEVKHTGRHILTFIMD